MICLVGDGASPRPRCRSRLSRFHSPPFHNSLICRNQHKGRRQCHRFLTFIPKLFTISSGVVKQLPFSFYHPFQRQFTIPANRFPSINLKQSFERRVPKSIITISYPMVYDFPHHHEKRSTCWSSTIYTVQRIKNDAVLFKPGRCADFQGFPRKSVA